MTNSTPGNDDQRQALSSSKFIWDRKRRVSTVGGRREIEQRIPRQTGNTDHRNTVAGFHRDAPIAEDLQEKMGELFWAECQDITGPPDDSPRRCLPSSLTPGSGRSRGAPQTIWATSLRRRRNSKRFTSRAFFPPPRYEQAIW